MHQLCLDSSCPGATSIKACLTFFDQDSIYGKGFKGDAEVAFKGLDVKLSAAAQFGSLEDYKYFFVDAFGSFSPGIPIGPIALDGFGGGLSHHMQNTFVPANVDFENQQSAGSGLGEGMSGTLYTPNIERGLGLKAATTFALTGTRTLLNGSLEFGATFNSSHSSQKGLASMYMKGLAKCMVSPKINLGILDNLPEGLKKNVKISSDPQVDAALAGFVFFEMDFNRPSFSGDIGIFLNAGPLKGNMLDAPNKLADGNIFFNPDGWGIEFGLPQRPAKASLFLGPLGQIDLSAYFATGSSIPSIPDVPAKVKEIASSYKPLKGLDAPGAGVVFGANLSTELSLGVGGLIEGLLYAEIGFDVMIKRFNNVTCDNESIGINGWYGAGQAYAALKGEVKVAGANVFSAGVAAILAARLPNPVYLSGTVAVDINAFGLIEFNKSITVELGNDCTFEDNSEDGGLGMEVIAFFDPLDSAEAIELDQDMQLHLNVPINKEFTAYDASANEHTFEIKLLSIAGVSKDGTDLLLAYDEEQEDNIIDVKPIILFPQNDTLSFIATVEIFKNGKSIATETKEAMYYTQEGWDIIPETNVVASFPYNGMYNYYRGESINNYVQLDVGQPDLLLDIPEDSEQKLVLTNSSGESISIDYTFEIYDNAIRFSLDENNLANDEVYKLELIRTNAIEFASENEGTPPGAANEEPIESETAENDRILWEIYFRTSKYDSFRAKMQSINALSQETVTIGFQGGFTTMSKTNNLEPITTDEKVVLKYNRNTEWDDMFEDIGPHYRQFERTCEVTLADIYNDAEAVTIDEVELEIGPEEFKNGVDDDHIEQVINFQQSMLYMTNSSNLRNAVNTCIDKLFSDQTLIGASDNEGFSSPEAFIEDLLSDVYHLKDFQFQDMPNGARKVNCTYRDPIDRLLSSNNIITFIK